MLGRVKAILLRPNDSNFLWRIEFQSPDRFRIVHHSGLYLTAPGNGRVVVSPSAVDTRNQWRIWEFYRGLPAVIPESDSTAALFANPDTCYASYRGKPVYSSSAQWILQYAGSQEYALGYSAVPCPADYDGDGIGDVCIVLEDGTWYIEYSANNFDSQWDWSNNMLVITGVEEEIRSPAPPVRDFHLTAFPNPLTDHTTIRLLAKRSGLVTATIYDVLGREVAALWKTAAAGEWLTLRWDARDRSGNPVPAGLYFGRVQVDGRLLRVKMLVFH